MIRKYIAIFMMIIMMCAGVWIGGKRSLGELKTNVDHAFTDGIDGSDSITSAVSRICVYSQKLTAIAGKYLGAADGAVLDTVYFTDCVDLKLSPGAIFNAYRELTDSVDILYKAVSKLQLPDSDTRDFLLYYSEIKSCETDIKNNGYNSRAQEYNSLINAFPTAIITKITGTPQAELFE